MTQDQGPQGAASITLSRTPFATLTSNRMSPFAPSVTSAASQPIGTAPTYPTTTSSLATSSMAATSAFMSPPTFRNGSFATTSPYSMLNGGNSFDRDASMQPVGTPSLPSTILIRRLPLQAQEDTVRLMLVFSKEKYEVQMLPPEQSEDPGFCAATVKFRSPASAQQAKEILNGKTCGSSEMIVDLLPGSPTSSRRNPNEGSVANASSDPSSTTSSGPTSRQPSRYNNGYTVGKISPPLPKLFGPAELPNPVVDEHFQSIFSPQSPIGNHLTEQRGRMSSKNLINHDAADDDEELLNNLATFGGNSENSHPQARRATAPQLPVGRFSQLSLNTNPVGPPSSVPHYGHSHANMTPMSAHGNTMSPTVMNNASHSSSFQSPGPPYLRHNFPPVNPADQNPPCNTLYVGNLPIDTSEEELKAMFAKQRGYKRLCFRTKQNGPMCFVEFEDVSFATKALNDLYGHCLHNSIKGGIRLSFSKNPLGVRSGPGQGGAPPMNGMNNPMASAGNGFTTVNGPPPGLPGPQGMAARPSYGSALSMSNGHGSAYSTASYSTGLNNVNNVNNGWSVGGYPGPLSTGGTSSPMPAGGSSSPFPPSYMLGR